MKKLFIAAFCLSALMLVVSCEKPVEPKHDNEQIQPKDSTDQPTDPIEEIQPTEKEKNMVTEPMAWRLDSMLYIYNPGQEDESREIIREEDDLEGLVGKLVYYLYPASWQFPSDLTVSSLWDGFTLYVAEELAPYKDFCKYIMRVSGEDKAYGYLWYYKDEFFTFDGIKTNGSIQYFLVTSHGWENGIWTLEYDPVDGVVKCFEYLSHVE